MLNARYIIVSVTEDTSVPVLVCMGNYYTIAAAMKELERITVMNPIHTFQILAVIK